MLKTSTSRKTFRATMTFIFILPLLLWGSQVASADTQLCLARVCSCENFEEDMLFKMDCSRVFLHIVPPVDDWTLNVTHLDLSANNISALNTELSHGSLQVLDLSHNQISRIVQNAFGGLQKLQYLNLANNMITSFDENGFYGLDHLISLNLSSNNLRDLPDVLFYNFIGLQELSLADNPLGHLNPVHYNRMAGLKWLDLSNTDLYSLPPNIFRTTVQLEFLDLSANEFYQVPTDALRSAKSLRHVRLNENKMDVLDKNSFIQLTTLENLELSDMASLVKISEKTFSHLVNLTVLEIKYNHRLTSIDSRAFEGLFLETRPTLEELDLEGNQLHSMDKATVPCAKLRKFNVQKNPWICDCTLNWIKKCQIQNIYAADLKCSSPEKLENAMIYHLAEEDFSCEYQQSSVDITHHDNVVKSMSLVLAVGLLLTLALGIALIFRWKDIRSWYHYKTRGPGAVYYVRARSNPGSGVNPA